ncbi:DMT family transporter [Sphingomonas mollis]|uniref:DMT family transporter n=1 Tax=Sphingomonas mollis TaxID=2795726 RepID=A0ABS0XK04_9SPHN|nr:DMT family transporter [Sphingomonas sp. BT553]MBJ6120370.1 DMT family transporter [Sphingomonas sp. BT553]
MSTLFPLIAVLLAGIGVAVQAPTNAMLARTSGSILLASLMSFAGGTAILFSLWLAFDRTSPSTLKDVPGWAWLGGFYGAVFVAAVAFAAPRLGLATTLTVAIATQVAAALALDHFGWFGLKSDPVSITKLAGAALMLIGVVVIRRG